METLAGTELSYRKEWLEYRKIRDLLVLAFLVFMPMAGLFAAISAALWDNYSVGHAALAGWMLFFVICTVRYNLWSCPRCKKTFAGGALYNLSWAARRCVHCGLPKPNPLPKA